MMKLPLFFFLALLFIASVAAQNQAIRNHVEQMEDDKDALEGQLFHRNLPAAYASITIAQRTRRRRMMNPARERERANRRRRMNARFGMGKSGKKRATYGVVEVRTRFRPIQQVNIRFPTFTPPVVAAPVPTVLVTTIPPTATTATGATPAPVATAPPAATLFPAPVAPTTATGPTPAPVATAPSAATTAPIATAPTTAPGPTTSPSLSAKPSLSASPSSSSSPSITPTVKGS